MAATRDARTAKRKLSELGITSATVLTGSTTITIDLAAFDEMVGALRAIGDLIGEAELAEEALSRRTGHRPR